MPNISDMPAPGPLTGLELIPVLQGGGSDGNVALPLLVNNSAFGGAVLALRVPMAADLSATSEADPGAAGVRWNNVDPHSATELYISDVDGTGADLAALFASLATGGYVYVQGAANSDARDNLQRCQVTSVVAGAGYTRLAVTVQASGGTFADDDALELIIQQPKPASDGGVQTIVAGAGVSVDSSDPANPVVSAGGFDVTIYGAVGNGVTDDTAAIQAAIDAAATAGGGVVCFPAGVYIVAGALQDALRGNAQLLLPSIDVLTGAQITIELRGPFAPTPDISVIGDIPVAVGGAILKSTLVAGSGGQLLGGWGPSGSAGDFTNILAVLRNLTLRMPDNPTHSAADLSRVACVDLDDVVVDTGSYYVEGLPEPTTSTSYGFKLPRISNGARTSVGVINAVGFYTGFLLGEHATGREFNAWGCRYAAESPAGFHACIIQRLQSIHCQNGLRATGGESYLQVGQFNIEHATTGWWVPVYDVDDPSNYLNGNLRWHVVEAGTGVDNTFTINGSASFACTQLGDNTGGGAISAAVVNTALTVSNVYAADVGDYTRFTATSAKTLTVRPNSIEALPANGEWHFRNVGAGNLTLVEGTGVTVTPPAGGTLAVPPGGTVTLKRVAADNFDLTGQTVAA